MIFSKWQQTKPSQRKTKARRQSWLSEEALQIAEERRKVNSKGERERYIQLNAELQRMARTYKKAFFNEQCIKPEGNNRRGTTRDHFRKLGISREHLLRDVLSV